MDDAPPSLVERLRATPTRAPEILALAATERLGPAVREWARSHTGREAAEGSVDTHVRLARAGGAATGAAGIVGVLPDLVALGWVQARMVLQIAAALGHDPTDRERTAELLVLWEYFDDVGQARRALDHEGKLMAFGVAGRTRQRDKGVISRLARLAGRRARRAWAGAWSPGSARSSAPCRTRAPRASSASAPCGSTADIRCRPPPSLRSVPVLLRDLTDDRPVDLVLLVAEAEVRTRRRRRLLRLVLADRSRRLPCVVREDVERLVEHLVPGRAVRVRGHFRVHPKYGPELHGCCFGAAPDGTYDPAALADGPPRPPRRWRRPARARGHGAGAPPAPPARPRARAGQRDVARLPRRTAAKRYHHSYAHGLLEHSLTVAQGVSRSAPRSPGSTATVAVTGALLHDIGKLEAYAAEDGAVEMTDAGKLLGEIPLGYYRIRREIEELPGFPAALAQAVLHIILAHHGALEHGSPVVPCTREATLVHFVDNLGGRLGSFDRLEKELAAGASWSAYDRALGGSAFFGPRAEPVPAEPATAEPARDHPAAEPPGVFMPFVPEPLRLELSA
jgi:3'-5' exoribonuclease